MRIHATKSTFRTYAQYLMALLFLLLVAMAACHLRSLSTRNDALINAVLNRDYSNVDRLLHQGVNPNLQIGFDSEGRPFAWSPLAVMGSKRRSSGNPARSTPLIIAAGQGDDKLVRLLLVNGAHINAEAHDSRQTALLAAIQGKHATTTELLIQNHADLNIHDVNGVSVVLWAVRSEEVDVLIVVLKYQTESISQTYHGISPLDLARNLKNRAMIRALEEYIRQHGDKAGD
ncbi:MAG: hypothetical protein JWN14_4672 [Chthonomonadales bacterium]|nr:hypothetical protein [Chthonomonadales bacterium]